MRYALSTLRDYNHLYHTHTLRPTAVHPSSIMMDYKSNKVIDDTNNTPKFRGLEHSRLTIRLEKTKGMISSYPTRWKVQSDLTQRYQILLTISTSCKKYTMQSDVTSITQTKSINNTPIILKRNIFSSKNFVHFKPTLTTFTIQPKQHVNSKKNLLNYFMKLCLTVFSNYQLLNNKQLLIITLLV